MCVLTPWDTINRRSYMQLKGCIMASLSGVTWVNNRTDGEGDCILFIWHAILNSRHPFFFVPLASTISFSSIAHFRNAWWVFDYFPFNKKVCYAVCWNCEFLRYYFWCSYIVGEDWKGVVHLRFILTMSCYKALVKMLLQTKAPISKHNYNYRPEQSFE